MAPETDNAEGRKSDRHEFASIAAEGAFDALVLGAAATLAWSSAPSWLEAISGTFLWSLAAIGHIALGVAVYMQRGPVPEPLQDLEERRRTSPQRPGKLPLFVHRLFQLVFVILLISAGRFLLVGVFLAIPFVQDAQRIEQVRWLEGTERPKVSGARWASYRVVRAVIKVIGLTSVTFGSVFVNLFSACGMVWNKTTGLRLSKALRAHFGRPEGFTYFLYSEPHQRAHFLDEGGLLAPFGSRVVARDWRMDVKTQCDDFGWLEYRETPEGRLLGRFEVSNLHEDLPLVVLVAPGRGPEPFRLSTAYRARLRDKGEALTTLERKIGQALAKVFPEPRDATA